MSTDVLAWFGSLCGIAGAMLLAANVSFSGYGYIFFFASSVSLLVWAALDNHPHQAIMQLVFTCINLVGAWRWLL